ncbi:MAG: hypothetical protein FWE90_10840 [Defluviitaleaceae bacterium]|nr:hypothetical protein [Defluviitaleaceae bacterium]
MEYIRQSIVGDKLADIFNIPSALRKKKAEIIILFSDDHVDAIPIINKRPIGFAKGAEVPDSFFEPLPEEELQLWGL